jgi:hypothetical protein
MENIVTKGPISKTLETESFISKENGIVAMLDVLGVRALQSIDQEKFITKWGAIGRLLEKLKSGIETEIGVRKTSITVVSDTLIITVSDDDLVKVLTAVTVHVAIAFNEAIKTGVYLRGAIGFGRFLQHNKVEGLQVGEAINDAANWHQQYNWIGISMTPKLIMKYEYLIANKLIDPVKSNYIKSKVKTKSGNQISWCLNWPKTFISLTQEANGKTKTQIAREYLLNQFAHENLAPDISDKYVNTMEFFDFCISRADVQT